MMYNRYIPGSNGTYYRQQVTMPEQKKPHSNEDEEISFQPNPRNVTCPQGSKGLDLGDILLLCVIAILFIDSDEEDRIPLIIAAAAYLFLQ